MAEVTIKNIEDEINMLEYTGCKGIGEVISKMYYWDFFISLSKGYKEYGSLTEKQYKALISMIEKHTDSTCLPYEINHEGQYSKQSTGNVGTRKKVEHNFADLKVIQLFDLPYENGEVCTATFYPYNGTHCVIELGDKYYKIPKPVKWVVPEYKEIIKFKYKRTEMKGYMDKIERN